MKLSRLLVTILLLLWLLILVGMLAISTRHTHDYLQNQLRSHAQDTATSLGLSLGGSVGAGDLAVTDSMVNALFGRGDYRRIVIRGAAGEILVQRDQPVQVRDVPAWFTSAFALETTPGNAPIMHGGKQAGTVEVVSHPGFAYTGLWQISAQAFWWVTAVGIVAFLLVALVLRLALAPLADMERQALGVSRREFATLKKLPWARELRPVAEAMNSMSIAVARVLGEQTALAARMRAKAYQDGVTGLANGRSFRERLDHLLGAPEEFSAGALLLIRLDRFDEYNDRHGHVAGNQVLRLAAQALGSVGCRHQGCLLGRMNGPEFALLAPDIAGEEIGALGDAAIAALKALRHGEEGAPAHVGIALCRVGQKASELLSAADTALAAAQESGASCWRLQDAASAAAIKGMGAADRKVLVETALHAHAIVLHYQPVFAMVSGALMHREALARIAAPDGALLPAGSFMQAVNQHGLAAEFDKQVVAQVLALDAAAAEQFAVNLSGASLQSPAFVDWLCAQLEANAAAAGRLVFETAELAVLDNLDAARAAITRIRRAGARFGVDRFGHSAASLGHLRSLGMDYIKIDGSFVRPIEQSEDSQFFLQALTGIAHGLGIKVIAEAVENQAEWDALKELRIDGAKGHFVGAPQALS